MDNTDNMDVATASAVAALAIAIVALVVALAQVLQQYFVTGQLIRLCDSVVFGDLPGKGHRVWQMSQLRFRVVYEMPQIGLPPDLWPSSATASLAQNEGSLRDVMKLARKPTLSAAPPIPTQRPDDELQRMSQLRMRWDKVPLTLKGAQKPVEGEASWALFCRAVYPSCRESILLSFKCGDADRCPAELPTVPMPASLRDIVVMALMAGMECTAASFERGSVSMQGAPGTITSAQHPILGPLIHFSPMNMDVRHGVGSHGMITKEWLWRVMDNCIVAGNHYNGRGRRAVEMEVGKFSKRYREYGPEGGKDLVPIQKRQRSSTERRGSSDRRRPQSQRRASFERRRPEVRASGAARPRQESPQRPIPGTDGRWSLISTAASDLRGNMYAHLTSNELSRPDFRTFKASQELRNKKARERDAKVRLEILKLEAEQRARGSKPTGFGRRRGSSRSIDSDTSSEPGSESSSKTVRSRYGSRSHRRRQRHSQGADKVETTASRERIRTRSRADEVSSETSLSSRSADDDSGTGRSGSRYQIDRDNGNPAEIITPEQTIARLDGPGLQADAANTDEHSMALVLRKRPPSSYDEEHERGRHARHSRRKQILPPRLELNGVQHESTESPPPRNILRQRKRETTPASHHRSRPHHGRTPQRETRITRRNPRRDRETELFHLRAERDRINDARLGNINWFWLSQTDILPGFWATPWRSFEDLNHQVCVGATRVIVEGISALTNGAGLLYSEYPPPPSSPMSNNLAATLDWLHAGKSTFPAYAYNSRGGVVCGGIFSSVAVPAELFTSPIPAIELLFPAAPQSQSASQKGQQGVERRFVELMRLDAWLSIVGRTRAIRDGPSAMLVQTPAVVRSVMDLFELDFLDADTSSLEGGAQVNKAVAASLVDNLEGNTLVGAEVLYALVAMLRAVKVGECVLTGPDTRMLAEILEKDVQVSLV